MQLRVADHMASFEEQLAQRLPHSAPLRAVLAALSPSSALAAAAGGMAIALPQSLDKRGVAGPDREYEAR